MAPLTIYIPSAFMATGGLYHRLERLMRALVVRGHRVVFFSSDPPPEGAKWVRTLKLPTRVLTQATFALSYDRLAGILARTMPPDRIVAFGEYYAHRSAALAKRIPVPLLLFIRGRIAEEWEIAGKSEWMIRRAARWEKQAFAAADRIVTNSAFAATNIRPLAPKARMEVIPNEIDHRHFHPLPDRLACRDSFSLERDRFWLGCVGKLITRKDPLTLLQAFARIETPSANLLFVGDGPQEAELRTVARNLGLSDRVRFLPWQKRMNELYNALDLLVMPSRHEGCPNVLLEALGAGTPCLGSDAGGVAEILADPALVYPTGDAAALTALLKGFLAEPHRAEAIRAACQAQIPRYDFDWENRMCDVIEA